MFRVLERFLWLLHGDKSFFSDNDLDSRDQKESYCSNLRGILFAYRNHPTFMTTVWLETFLFFPLCRSHGNVPLTTCFLSTVGNPFMFHTDPKSAFMRF